MVRPGLNNDLVQSSCPHIVLGFYYFNNFFLFKKSIDLCVCMRERERQRERERDGERDRETDRQRQTENLLFHLLMHSLADCHTYPDRGWNPQPRRIETVL